MSAPPFLTVEERVQYLYDREYFAPGTVGDDHRAGLAEINFHYFPGMPATTGPPTPTALIAWSRTC